MEKEKEMQAEATEMTAEEKKKKAEELRKQLQEEAEKIKKRNIEADEIIKQGKGRLVLSEQKLRMPLDAQHEGPGLGQGYAQVLVHARGVLGEVDQRRVGAHSQALQASVLRGEVAHGLLDGGRRAAQQGGCCCGGGQVVGHVGPG